MYFGEDIGKQCVAMSLSALIFNKIKGIHSCNDLVQIMEMLLSIIVFNTVTMYRAGVFNANRIIVNDWRSLCLRKIIYELNLLQ